MSVQNILITVMRMLPALTRSAHSGVNATMAMSVMADTAEVTIIVLCFHMSNVAKVVKP